MAEHWRRSGWAKNLDCCPFLILEAGDYAPTPCSQIRSMCEVGSGAPSSIILILKIQEGVLCRARRWRASQPSRSRPRCLWDGALLRSALRIAGLQRTSASDFLLYSPSRRCPHESFGVISVWMDQGLGPAVISEALAIACVSIYSRMFVTLPFRTVMAKTQ